MCAKVELQSTHVPFSEPEMVRVLQKYRLYLKRMSGLHPGANGRKGVGKGSSGSPDASFQVYTCTAGFLQDRNRSHLTLRHTFFCHLADSHMHQCFACL